MKSVWNEKPLNKLDLLKVVREEQHKDSKRTKMDIFRELSKKYKNILTADQFNFRYNYLVQQERKRLKIKQANEHKHCSGRVSEEIMNSIPRIAPTELKYVEPGKVEISVKRPERIDHELRDKNQKLLNIDKAIWEIIDPSKLVTFCDKQLELQKKRKGTGGLNIIFKTLASIFDQKLQTVASRYYVAKRDKKSQLSQIEKLQDEVSHYKGTLIVLETQLKECEKKNLELRENYSRSGKDWQKLNQKYNELENDYLKLKRRPLVKLSLFIDSIVAFFREG